MTTRPAPATIGSTTPPMERPMDNWSEVNARLAAIELLLPRMLAQQAVVAGARRGDVERFRADMAEIASVIPITGDVDEATFRPELAARIDAIVHRATLIMDEMRKL